MCRYRCPLGEGRGEGGASPTLADEQTSSGTVNWYFTDNQGTVRDIAQYNAGTNTTSVVDHLKFDSFGNITAQSNSANQPLFAYTGQMFDATTGLYWYHARWYDPHTGRFISQDPSGFKAGDPNLYRYVVNDPTNFVDPTGLSSDPSDGGQAAAAAEAAAAAQGQQYGAQMAAQAAQQQKVPDKLPPVEHPPGLSKPQPASDGTYYQKGEMPDGTIAEYWRDSNGNIVAARFTHEHENGTTIVTFGINGVVQIEHPNGTTVLITPNRPKRGMKGFMQGILQKMRLAAKAGIEEAQEAVEKMMQQMKEIEVQLLQIEINARTHVPEAVTDFAKRVGGSGRLSIGAKQSLENVKEQKVITELEIRF